MTPKEQETFDAMLEALVNVNKLISEAAMVGFNCNDGDWPERLFFSQQMTSNAIRKAQGRELKSMALVEASKEACKQATLIDALTWIAVWETERIVKQARMQDTWDTCFRLCF